MDTPTPVQTRPDRYPGEVWRVSVPAPPSPTDERLDALARVARTKVQHLDVRVPEMLGGGTVTTQMVTGELGDLTHWMATRGTRLDLLCLLNDRAISYADLAGIVAADRAGEPIDDLRYALASDF